MSSQLSFTGGEKHQLTLAVRKASPPTARTRQVGTASTLILSVTRPDNSRRVSSAKLAFSDIRETRLEPVESRCAVDIPSTHHGPRQQASSILDQPEDLDRQLGCWYLVSLSTHLVPPDCGGYEPQTLGDLGVHYELSCEPRHDECDVLLSKVAVGMILR